MCSARQPCQGCNCCTDGTRCRLERELDIRATELRLLQEQAKGSESAQLADTVAATETGLAAASAAAESARKHKADMANAAQV